MSMLIGEKIKKIRLERKISQEKLANHLYVSRQTISRWETGKVIPNMDNILQLSTFLMNQSVSLLEKKKQNQKSKLCNLQLMHQKKKIMPSMVML